MFTLEFKIEGAAFDEPGECQRILRKVAEQMDAGAEDAVIFDVNGNRIGEWAVHWPIDDEDEPDPEEAAAMEAEGLGTFFQDTEGEWWWRQDENVAVGPFPTREAAEADFNG